MKVLPRFRSTSFYLVAASLGFSMISWTIANEGAEVPVVPEPVETPFMSDEDYDDFEDAGLALQKPLEDEGSQDRRTCVGLACEGDRVRVVRGSLRGFTGLVLEAVPTLRKIRIVTDTRIRTLLSPDDVRPISMKADCFATFCRGDKAKIAGRWKKGFQGYVVGFDRGSDRVQLRRTHSGPVVDTHIVFLRHARF